MNSALTKRIALRRHCWDWYGKDQHDEHVLDRIRWLHRQQYEAIWLALPPIDAMQLELPLEVTWGQPTRRAEVIS